LSRSSQHVRRRGFTLLEALVATTILGAGIVGTLSVFSMCQRRTARTMHLDEAVDIAQSRMAITLSTPADRIAPAGGSIGRYQWAVSYAEKPYGLVQATVTVTWPEGGQPETYKLSQLFTPP
jgi:prepilin-type N-terminal cleavage/methylation domain-containing protein